MTDLHNPKLLGFDEGLLFKLCIYRIYGPSDLRKVAWLFNQNHEGTRVSAKEVQQAWIYMHDNSHPSWERARDLDRDQPDLLKNILRDELHFTDDELQDPINKPAKALTTLRPNFVRRRGLGEKKLKS